MNEGLPTHLDIFSGVGGFSLAFEAEGFRTIGFSEIDPYACAVLKKHWPAVPNFGDIKNVTAQAVANAASIHAGTRQSKRPKARTEVANGHNGAGRPRSLVTVLTGGFPCQPFSVAGKRRGAGDDRALWPEMLSVIEQVRPAFVLGENVPGIINMELDRVLSDLEAIGYATRTFVIPACAVDARHRRDRVWIVGHPDERGIRRAGAPRQTGHASFASETLADAESERFGETRRLRRNEQTQRPASSGQDVPNTQGVGLQGQRASGEQFTRTHARQAIPLCDGGNPAIWLPESGILRVADGVPNRSHRLRCLGNSIVPAIARVFAKAIYREITT